MIKVRSVFTGLDERILPGLIDGEQRIVGSLSETHVYAAMVKDPAIRKEPVRSIMQKPFRYVDIETPVKLLASMITAVFVTRTFYMIWLDKQPSMQTLSI